MKFGLQIVCRSVPEIKKKLKGEQEFAVVSARLCWENHWKRVNVGSEIGAALGGLGGSSGDASKGIAGAYCLQIRNLGRWEGSRNT